MSSNPDKPEFTQVVKEWMERNNWSFDRLGKAVGVGRTTLTGYVETNEFGPHCIPALTATMHLEERTPEALEKVYRIKWKGRRKPKHTPYDYRSCVSAIDRLHEELRPVIERLAGITRNIYQHTSEQNFFISSTTGASLLILDEESAESKEQRSNRFAGLDNGLIWAFVTPTAAFTKKHAGSTSLSLDRLRKENATRFMKLRGSYIEHLKNRNIADPEATAHLRMQHLEWDEFPYTPFHWTVSLLGERTLDGTINLRAIVRSPNRQTGSSHLFPGGNQAFERDLLNYFRHIVESHRNQTRARLRSRHSRWKMNFCDAMLVRMREDGSYPR